MNQNHVLYCLATSSHWLIFVLPTSVNKESRLKVSGWQVLPDGQYLTQHTCCVCKQLTS